MSSIADNYASVKARIDAACARAGRDPRDVRLIWVSKNHPQESALEARRLGARYFGENRVQEALEKFPLPDGPSETGGSGAAPGPTGPAELHLIGRLQKNKVRKILPVAAAIHSVDSLELLASIDRVAGELGLKRDVFLQVNTSREPAKGGFEPEGFLDVLRTLPQPANLRVVGLMTMGPLPPEGAPADPEEARRCFRELAGLLRAARTQGGPALHDFAFLSMGMTGDFEIAVEEGAHFLRIGTALFGARAM